MARIFSIACFAVVAGIFVSAIANEYCEMSCKNPFERRVYKHTMCAYPSPNPGPACVNPSSQGLSDAEKRAIVQRHNELRRRVASGKESRGKTGPQPSAEDMPDLTWDTELETIAQRWTSQCIWEHDKCRNVKRFERVGQNMAYTDVPGKNKDSVTDDLVQQWYDEVDDFDRRVIPNYQSTGEFVNHYVQMVWAKTKKIGCGRIKYDESGYNRQVLICNYAPGGNMFGQPIYKIKS